MTSEKRLTWGEFKSKMQQRGVTDDTPICTIWYEPGSNEFELAFHPDGAVDVGGTRAREADKS